jgi:CheY-like chemotaxis protein
MHHTHALHFFVSSQSAELKHLRLEVHQAINDADVRSKLAEHGKGYFDFIILDEHLGEDSMLGSELTKQLRQEGVESFIIACSGNCLPTDAARYRAAGACCIWPKPFPSTAHMRLDLLRAAKAAPQHAQQGSAGQAGDDA